MRPCGSAALPSRNSACSPASATSAARCPPEDAVVVQIGEAPASAVDGDHDGKFSRPSRRIEMPLQRYAAVNGVFDFAALSRCTIHCLFSLFSAAARPLL